MFARVEKEAKTFNIQIKGSTAGFQTIPMLDDQPMDDAHFQQLSSEKKKKLEKNIQTVQKMLKEMVQDATVLDRYTEEDVEELNEETARIIVESQFHHLRKEFKDYPEVAEHIEDVIFDIIENVYAFLEPKNNNSTPANPGETIEQRKVNKYTINHVVDNSRLKGAPVIYEMNPTYNNLFGRIEKKSYLGYLYTDYTMIRAGSLLKANGGYLVLDMEQVLRQSFVYDALKRALRGRCLVIEDVNELHGVMTSAGLKPQPIKLNLKVIIIGQSHMYHLLHRHDEDFRKIFKVRADFDYEVKETRTSINKYIKFISRVVREEKLRHFDRGGVQSVINHAFRLTDHQQRLSIRFSEIVRLLREASYWAAKRGHRYVSHKDVSKALLEEKYRRNLVEEKIQNSIRENTIKFDLVGKEIGQINGLAVYNMGDYSFGKPSRITVSTYIGSRGIVNIEREAKLSGKLHDKGVFILSGFFASKFGTNIPMSFSASVTFEQSYGMIDGDSASCAELYALLSSLSQLPISQGIAVTGSVNHKGQVQAIGGANEKIEGFFETCKIHRLTGKQGVIIPESNVDSPAGQKHQDGSFTKDSVFDLVRKRLVEFSTNAKRFGKQLDKAASKLISDEESEEEEEQ